MKNFYKAICVILTICGLVLPMSSAAFANDKTIGNTDWLSGIDDNAPISQVNTPGTHNSAAFNVTNIVLGFSKCQDKSLEKQFDCGVRYFDFRFTYADNMGENDKDRLTVCHSIVPCFKEGTNAQFFSNPADILRYDDVVNSCRSILEKHPTEYIIFSFRYDTGSENKYGSDFVNELLCNFSAELAKNNPDKFIFLRHNSKVPTVGEARGKVIFALQNWDGFIRNERCVTNNFGDGVINRIRLLLKTGFGSAPALDFDNTDKSLRVVHLSTYKALLPMNPKLCSLIINNWFLEKLPFKKFLGTEMPELKQGTHYGWLLFDFVNSEVCSKVIGLNEELLKK